MVLVVLLVGCGAPDDEALYSTDSGVDHAVDVAPESAFVPDSGAGLDAGVDLDSAVEPDAAVSDAGKKPLGVAEFTATARSKASFGSCEKDEMPVLGFAPKPSSAKYPLFIWTVGTLAKYDGKDVRLILREMASRGLVAVSPSYDNGLVLSCAAQLEKTMCLYKDQPGSLVAKMCARPDVDCNKGILSGGHSQGAIISITAKNYEPRVQAVLGMGATCDYLLDLNDGMCNPNGALMNTDCVHHSKTQLPKDRLRIVNGEADEYGSQLEIERLSGKNCASGQADCLSANGSGWYRVPNSDVQDGKADHCFMVNSTDGAFCPDIDAKHPFDVGWLPPAAKPWSLRTNLDWLTSFAKP